ncbi:MAG: phage tail tube protein [Faecalibacterium sp.]
MTVQETLTKSGITPSADYTGVEMANDFVFAICTDAAKQTQKTDWIVCADHVKEHSGALNVTTSNDEFIRTGPCATKGSVQRTLSVNGNRCVGDAFQDFVLSHKIKFGSGADVIVPYLYFSLRTGKGECGQCALILTSDAGGGAGSAATFACDVKGIGRPEEFDYTTDAVG